MSVPTSETLLPYAKMLNVDFVWVHASATVLESTLAHSLNSTGTKTLVVEMGVGMRITKEYCMQLIDEIINLLVNLKMLADVDAPEVREPIVSLDGAVGFLNSPAAGIFVPDTQFGSIVSEGDIIGRIVDPLTDAVVENAIAPCSGRFLAHVKQMVTEFTTDDGLVDFGLPYALKRSPRPYDTTTLNYNWQLWNTKAYSLFTHSTDDMKEDSADNALNAILRFMKNRGIINYPIHAGYVTSVIHESDMFQVHSPCGGICRIKTKIGDVVERGQVIAEILNPLTCEVLAEIKAPEKSTVFFHFASPLIVEGTVIFKLVKNEIL